MKQTPGGPTCRWVYLSQQSARSWGHRGGTDATLQTLHTEQSKELLHVEHLTQGPLSSGFTFKESFKMGKSKILVLNTNYFCFTGAARTDFI